MQEVRHVRRLFFLAIATSLLILVANILIFSQALSGDALLNHLRGEHRLQWLYTVSAVLVSASLSAASEPTSCEVNT